MMEPVSLEEIVRRIRLSLMRKGVRFSEIVKDSGIAFHTKTGSIYEVRLQGDQLELSFSADGAELKLTVLVSDPEYLHDFLARLSKLRRTAIRLSNSKP